MTNKQKATELDKKFRDMMFSPKEYHFTDCLLEMAEWKEQQMIEKAVKWLENNVKVNGAFYCFAFKKDDIESFKQAMQGE